MRRSCVAVLAALVAAVGLWSPSAGATENAGPWDVSMTWYHDPGSGSQALYVRAKVSVDLDDEVTNRYRLCIRVASDTSTVTYYQPALKASDAWSGDTSTSNGILSLDAANAGPIGGAVAPVSSVRAWVIPVSGTACGATMPTGALPIRGRSNVLEVPAEFISNTNGTPADPLDSGEAPPAIVDGYAAGLECGRTLRQEADGDWRVDLFARNREDLPDGATLVTDGYTANWGTGVDVVDLGRPEDLGDSDHALTDVLVPDVGDMPPWGWVVTYHQRVEFEAGHAGEGPPLPDEGSEFVDDDDTGPWWSPFRAVTEAADSFDTLWDRSADGLYYGYGYLTGELGPGDAPTYESGAHAPVPSGAQFYDEDGEPINGGDFYGGAVDFYSYQVTCSVVIDPTSTEWPSGASTAPSFGPVQPPRPESVGPEPEPVTEPDAGGGGCDAGPLGNIPVIGGVFDGFARMVCGLGDLLGRLLDGILDGLQWLFIPDGLDLGDYEISCDDRFPCNWGASVVDGISAMVDGMSGGLAGDDCGPGVTFDYDGHEVGGHLPAPSDSGCAGTGAGGGRTAADNAAGDLFGYRTLVRNLALVLLYIAFARRMLSFLPWGGASDLPSP